LRFAAATAVVVARG